MDLQLADKTALVTGSSLGIGFAIARSLAAEGATVYLNSRRQDKLDEAMAKISAELPQAKLKGVAADLGTAAGVAALVAKLPAVDILINNVGIFEPKSFQDISDEDWMRFFEVNVMSGVRLSRAYLPAMKKKNWGRIMFISSESGVQIPREMIHYGMTKTAQISVARGLAEDCVGTNITVNSVLPGPTSSDGVADFVDNMAAHSGKSKADIEKDFFETVRPSSLIKRFATTEEVAALVTYLSSPLASATTGSAMRVDGGVVRAIV
ncbi:MAG: SDR family oxidoreductase [Cyanobacteria bacterium SZAS TMP-1]|nr:SDR family oxidoreductase [Cyanobacteria bacterium SZAS TMP-1]